MSSPIEKEAASLVEALKATSVAVLSLAFEHAANERARGKMSLRTYERVRAQLDALSGRAV